MADTDELVLVHFGVKGMKWGVRKRSIDGVSNRTSRDASKDAKEFARAKMYYGEGAGTRRKLIKAKVEAKAKKDPSYKKAFDHHLDNQDLGKHASAARGQRKRTDVRNTTAKTSRGVYRLATGGFGTTTAAAGVIYAGYTLAKRTGIDQTIKRNATQTIRNLATSKSAKIGAEFLKNL